MYSATQRHNREIGCAAVHWLVCVSALLSVADAQPQRRNSTKVGSARAPAMQWFSTHLSLCDEGVCSFAMSPPSASRPAFLPEHTLTLRRRVVVLGVEPSCPNDPACGSGASSIRGGVFVSDDAGVSFSKLGEYALLRAYDAAPVAVPVNGADGHAGLLCLIGGVRVLPIGEELSDEIVCASHALDDWHVVPLRLPVAARGISAIAYRNQVYLVGGIADLDPAGHPATLAPRFLRAVPHASLSSLSDLPLESAQEMASSVFSSWDNLDAVAPWPINLVSPQVFRSEYIAIVAYQAQEALCVIGGESNVVPNTTLGDVITQFVNTGNPCSASDWLNLTSSWLPTSTSPHLRSGDALIAGDLSGNVKDAFRGDHAVIQGSNNVDIMGVYYWIGAESFFMPTVPFLTRLTHGDGTVEFTSYVSKPPVTLKRFRRTMQLTHDEHSNPLILIIGQEIWRAFFQLCRSCAPGTVLVTRCPLGPGVSVCRECSVCGASSYASRACSNTVQLEDTLCSPCSTCVWPLEVVEECTPTSDAVCGVIARADAEFNETKSALAVIVAALALVLCVMVLVATLSREFCLERSTRYRNLRPCCAQCTHPRTASDDKAATVSAAAASHISSTEAAPHPSVSHENDATTTSGGSAGRPGAPSRSTRTLPYRSRPSSCSLQACWLSMSTVIAATSTLAAAALLFVLWTGAPAKNPTVKTWSAILNGALSLALALHVVAACVMTTTQLSTPLGRTSLARYVYEHPVGAVAATILATMHTRNLAWTTLGRELCGDAVEVPWSTRAVTTLRLGAPGFAVVADALALCAAALLALLPGTNAWMMCLIVCLGVGAIGGLMMTASSFVWSVPLVRWCGTLFCCTAADARDTSPKRTWPQTVVQNPLAMIVD